MSFSFKFLKGLDLFACEVTKPLWLEFLQLLCQGGRYSRENLLKASINVARAKEAAQLGEVRRGLEGLFAFWCAIVDDEASGWNRMAEIIDLVLEKQVLREFQGDSSVA